MLNGDLSNNIGQVVAVKFEAVVYNFGKVNKPGKAYLEDLLYQGDKNILLITQMPERKVMAWCYKWAVPYSNVIQVDSVLEIPEITLAHHVSIYYDTDDRVLEQVRSRGKTRTLAIQWTQ